MQVIVPIRAKNFESFETQYKKINGKADIVELWLDQIQDVDTFFSHFEIFVRGAPERFLGVCKTPEEGGDFNQTPEEKSHLMHLFLKHGGHAVDFDMARNPLKVIATFPGEKLWLSFHDYQGVPDDLETIRLGMYVLEPSVYKFSVTTNTKEAIERFMQFIADESSNTKAIYTTMGKLGAQGREKIGSKSWGAFYALDEGHKTAEGQPVITELP